METDLKKMLKKHEGFKGKPYTDTVGKLTIGYGRNLTDNGISKEEAEIMLQNDINTAKQELLKVVPNILTLSPARQAVLIDMMVNLGATKFKKFKKLLAAIQKEDFKEAAKEMLDSQWAIQVGQRAKELSALMTKGHF